MNMNFNPTSHLLPTLDTSPTETSNDKNNGHLGGKNPTSTIFAQNCSESERNRVKVESYESRHFRSISPPTGLKSSDFKEVIIDGFTICSFKSEKDLLAYAKQQESSSSMEATNSAKSRAKKKHSRVHDTEKRRCHKSVLGGSKNQLSPFDLSSNVPVSIPASNRDSSIHELPVEYRNGHVTRSLSSFASDSTSALYSSVNNLGAADNHSVLSQLCDKFLPTHVVPSTTTSTNQLASLFSPSSISRVSAEKRTACDVPGSDSATRNNYPRYTAAGIWDTGYVHSPASPSIFSTLTDSSEFPTSASIRNKNTRDCHLTPLSTNWNVQSEDLQQSSLFAHGAQLSDTSNAKADHCDRLIRVSSTGITASKPDNGYHYFSVAALTDEHDKSSLTTPHHSPCQRPRSNAVGQSSRSHSPSTPSKLSNVAAACLSMSPSKGFVSVVDCSKKRFVPFSPVSHSSCSANAQNGINTATSCILASPQSSPITVDNRRIINSNKSEAVKDSLQPVCSDHNRQQLIPDAVSPRLSGTRPAPNISHTCSFPLLSPDILQRFMGVSLEAAEQLSLDVHFKELYSTTVSKLIELGRAEVFTQEDTLHNSAATLKEQNDRNTLAVPVSSSTVHHLQPTNHCRDTVLRKSHAEDCLPIPTHPTDLRVLNQSTGVQQHQMQQSGRDLRPYSDEFLQSLRSSASDHQSVLASAKSNRTSSQKGRPLIVHPTSNPSSSVKQSLPQTENNLLMQKNSTIPARQQQPISRSPHMRETVASDFALQSQWEAYMRHLAASKIYPSGVPAPPYPQCSTSQLRFFRPPLSNNLNQLPPPMPPDYSIWRANRSSSGVSCTATSNVRIPSFLYKPVYGNKSCGRWADAHIRIAIFIRNTQALRVQSNNGSMKVSCTDQIIPALTHRSPGKLHKPIARRLPLLMPCPSVYPTTNGNPIRPSFPVDTLGRSITSHPSSISNRLYSPSNPTMAEVSYWNQIMGDLFATFAAELPTAPLVPNALSDVPWPLLSSSNQFNPIAFSQQSVVTGGYLPTAPNLGSLSLPFLPASTSSIPLNSAQKPKFDPPLPSLPVLNSKRRRLDCPRASIQPTVPSLEGQFNQGGPVFRFPTRGTEVINTAANLLNGYRAPPAYLPSTVPVLPNPNPISLTNIVLGPPTVHSSHLAPIHPW